MLNRNKMTQSLHKMFQIIKFQTRNNLILNNKEHRIQIIINKLLKNHRANKIIKIFVFSLRRINRIALIINLFNKNKKLLGKF